MVTKSRKASAGKKKIKVLNLKKETVKDLGGAERKRVKGGVVATAVSCRAGSLGAVPTVGQITPYHTYENVSGGQSGFGF